MSKQSKKRSDVWMHFEVIPNKVDKATCNYCKNTFSISGGSLGNLNRHLKKVHPTIPLRRSEQSEPNLDADASSSHQNVDDDAQAKTTEQAQGSAGISGCVQPTKRIRLQSDMLSYLKSTKPMTISKSKELDLQLLRMIVKGYYPFSIVEDPEFIKLLQMMAPGYKVPTRKTMSESLMLQVYNKTREKIQADLNSADFVSVTTDSWTSINNENYTAVTVHFLLEENDSLTLKSHLIDCFSYNERHTAENLAALLKSKFEEFQIEEKVICVVSDNAANILAAVRNGGWKSRGCFAHSINLLVQNGLKKISGILNKVKAIVTFFKQSSSALGKLKQVQKQMELPDVKLIQDVVTRWNSTLDMIERAVLLKDALISTLALENPDLNTITTAEWLILAKLVDILIIFKEITEEISAEKNVSISKILVFVLAIHNHIETYYFQELEPELRDVLEIFRQNFFKRFGDVEDIDILAESTVLDPRFKKYGFKEERKYTNAVMILRKKLTSIFSSSSGSSNTKQVSNLQATPQEKPESAKSMWTIFDKTVSNLLHEHNPTAAVIIEFDRYLAEPLINRHENPLQWWHERRHVYPTIYKFMKKRLCIPATSVPCERIFSKAGQIITEKRSRLKSKKVSQILFLNNNI